MKRTALFLLIITVFIGCDDEDLDPSEIVGTWRITEELLDPGDGSGVFMPVTDGKTVQFFSDNTYTASGSTCTLTSTQGQGSSGIYDPVEMRLTPANCGGQVQFYIGYELKDDFLFLYYPCIEPCAQKLVKVN